MSMAEEMDDLSGDRMMDVWRQSIEHWGARVQSVVCMEECAELIQAISKMLRGKDAKANLVEEMADVTICFNLLAMIYHVDQSQLDEVIRAKTLREARRMEADH